MTPQPIGPSLPGDTRACENGEMELAFQIISNDNPEDLRSRSHKKAREILDLRAEQERKGWKGVQLLAQDMFGKTKHFTIGECKELMKEVRKRRE